MNTKYTQQLLLWLALALVFPMTTVSAQSCNSIFDVHRGWDSRSVGPGDGTNFTLELRNNLSSPQTYDLTSAASSDPCNGILTNKSSGATGTFLNVDFKQNGVRSSVVTVPGNTTAVITARVEMAPDARANAWHCLEVIATSQSCQKDIVKQLKVYVSDGSEN